MTLSSYLVCLARKALEKYKKEEITDDNRNIPNHDLKIMIKDRKDNFFI